MAGFAAIVCMRSAVLLIGVVSLYRNPAASILAKVWSMAFLIISPLCGAAILLFYEVGPVAPSHDRFDDKNLSDGIKWALVLPGV